MVTVAQAVAALEQLWPLADAEAWDQPGLVSGNPDSDVTGILLSVDLTEAVISEAIGLGANLIVTHHPFLLRGVHSVAENTAKGAILASMIRHNIASFAAHTNADIADDGVSASIAQALGLAEIKSLTINGHGRVGVLERESTLAELIDLMVNVLPSTSRGVSASGNPDLKVRKVALCGGAGDAFIPDALSAGADVYITSDLRHHVTQDAGLPLIDVSHWASESLWLPVAAKSISAKLSIPIHISNQNTDPWIFRRNNEGNN